MSTRQEQRFALKSLFIATLSCYAPLALANPSGGTVVNGNATFQQQGNSLIVTNTPGTIINWQSFSIGAGELTKFVQQSSNSAVLNRVIGSDPSQILGQLQSNGRVFLINANGILFGRGAQIDTAGFAASTLDIANADFAAGKLKFQGGTTGSIQNAANITTPSGGFVYLIAPNIQNNGVIVSPKGEILLAAGSSVELVDGVDTSLRVQLTAPAGQVVNVGQLIADQGRIGIFAAAIQQQGLISANSASVGHNGEIVLKATQSTTLAAGSVTQAQGGGQVLVDTSAGDTVVQGSVDVSNASGKGGTVQLTGNRVGLFDGAQVNASGRDGGGSVLVGGDEHGANAAVHNSQETDLSANATINASATGSGDGGKVIVWSDGLTRTYGAVSARGGQNGGNGGFVEMSGKGHLDWVSSVDTSAAHGVGGTLLLDPTEIQVISSPSPAGALSDVSTFAAPNLDLSNNWTQIDPALLVGNVTLQATNNITFFNSVNNASGSINAQSQFGTIAVNGGVTINASNINFQTGLGGGGASGTINIAGNLNAPGGSIALSTMAGGSGGNISLSGNLTASNITFAVKPGTNSGSLTQTPTSTITASNVDVSFGSGNTYGANFAGTQNAIGSLTADLSASTGGSLTLVDMGSLSLGNIVSTGFVDIRSNGLAINGPISTAGGSYVNLDSGAGAMTTNGSLITADEVALQRYGGTGAIGTAANPIQLAPATAGTGSHYIYIGSGPAISSAYVTSLETAGQRSTDQLAAPSSIGTLVFNTQNDLTLNGAYTGGTNPLYINHITGTNSVALTSAGTLSTYGGLNVSAPSIAVSAPTIDYAAGMFTGSTVSMAADTFTLGGSGAVMTNPGATISVAPYTSGGALTLDSNLQTAIANASQINLYGSSVSLPNGITTGGLAVGATGSFTSGGDIDASAVNISAGGNVSISGAVNAATTIITAGGGISAAALNANNLGLTSGPSLNIATSASNVSLTSTQGSVNAQLTGGGSASLSAVGSVQFSSAGSATVSANSSNGGSITLNATGDLAATGASTTGGLTVSASGALTGSGLSGGQVSLTGGTTIGSSTTALGVNATGSLTASAPNGVYISQGGAISNAALTASSGDVVFSAAGNATVNAMAGGGTHLLSLTTTQGDLTVAGANNGNGNGALTLVAAGSLNVGSGVTLAGSSVTLGSSQAIGSSAAPLSLQTANLSVTSSGAGNGIYVSDNNLSQVTLSTNDGAIGLTSSGTGALAAQVNAGKGAVTMKTGGELDGSLTGGSLALTVGGTSGKATTALVLNALNVQLQGTGDVNATLSAGATANITASAGLTLNDTGALTLLGTAGSTATVVSGGDLTFAGETVAGTLTATTAGNVLGSGTGNQVAANTATFSAGGSIGPLNTSFQHFGGTATGSINVVNAIPLSLNSINGTNVSVASTGGLTTTLAVVGSGTVSLITHSPLTIGTGGVSAGTGVVLQSGTGTGHDDITINGAVATQTGNCSVTSGGGVQQNANITDGGSGAVSVSAATGDITMAPGTSTSTNGGSIGYSAQGNLTLAQLNAGSAGSVALTATTGNIGSATPGQLNIVGGKLAVNAGGSVTLVAQIPSGGVTVSAGSGSITDPSGNVIGSGTGGGGTGGGGTGGGGTGGGGTGGGGTGGGGTGGGTGGGSTGGGSTGGSTGGNGSSSSNPIDANQNQTVTAITTTTTNVTSTTNDTTTGLGNKQSGTTSGNGEGGTTTDDNKKKPKKC